MNTYKNLFKNNGTSCMTVILNVFIIRLEIENARLEATANKQSKEINTLQKGTHEAALVSLIFWAGSQYTVS